MSSSETWLQRFYTRFGTEPIKPVAQFFEDEIARARAEEREKRDAEWREYLDKEAKNFVESFKN